MLKLTKAVFLLAAMAIILAGCATTPGDDRGRTAVVFSVLKLEEQSSAIDGDRILSAVERVRYAVDGSAVVYANDLRSVVLEALDLGGLSPADRFLIESVIGRVEQQLVLDIETGALPEDYAVQLGVWLDWIEEAAYMAGASGGV